MHVEVRVEVMRACAWALYFFGESGLASGAAASLAARAEMRLCPPPPFSTKHCTTISASRSIDSLAPAPIAILSSPPPVLRPRPPYPLPSRAFVVAHSSLSLAVEPRRRDPPLPSQSSVSLACPGFAFTSAANVWLTASSARPSAVLSHPHLYTAVSTRRSSASSRLSIRRWIYLNFSF